MRRLDSTHKDAQKPFCAHECQQETGKETLKESERDGERDRQRGVDATRRRARNKESRIESVTAREQASGRQSAEGG